MRRELFKLLLCGLLVWGAGLPGVTVDVATPITPATLASMRLIWSVPFYSQDASRKYNSTAFSVDAKGRLAIAAWRSDPDYGSTITELRLYDANTGALRWSIPQESRAGTPKVLYDFPTVANEMVYASLGYATIIANDVATGQERWRVSSPVGTIRQIVPLSPTMLYLVGNSGSAALNPATGATLWTTMLLNSGGPVLANGKLYLTSSTGLHVLDQNTGVGHTIMAPGSTWGAAPLVQNGFVYFATSKFIYAVDLATEKFTWKYSLPAPAGSQNRMDITPNYPLATDGALLFVQDTQNFRILALNLTTGALVWNYPADGVANSSPLARPGMLFVTNKTGDVLNPASSSLLWKSSSICPASIWSKLELAMNDTLLVGWDCNRDLFVMKPFSRMSVKEREMPPTVISPVILRNLKR